MDKVVTYCPADEGDETASTSAPPNASTTSLVVWGSTGRRVQFSKQDLKMPDHLRSSAHLHFIEKQWETVAGFWYNRVLKEAALQHMTVADIIKLIEDDIERRWQRRRTEQAIHKKRKRLLSGNGPAGVPSSRILLTNLVALPEYTAMSAQERNELTRSIVDRVEHVTRAKVEEVEVLTDGATVEQESCKERRDEECSNVDAPKEQGSVFDDRVAVVCSLPSPVVAALAIAQLHRSRFDGRTVTCRFWSIE